MKCSALIHDNRCSQSVHSIVHDNRMFAERTFYCLNATQVEARRTDEKKPKGASGQMYQFFVEPSQIQGNRIVITGSDVNHIKNVLRMKPGEEIAVSNGTDGKEYRCGIEELLEEEIICTLRFIKEDGLELPARVTFFQGLPKADKMEFIVQKAVELGVSRIVPYLSKNCVSRPDKTEKKVERWRKIAAEAAKQCGRGRLPEVAAVVPVAQAIAQAAESETALFFYENERRTGLRDALASGVRDTVSLMGGPEGGFDPAEAKAAVDAGLQSVSLGTRILRCETAPIAALAAVLYAGGNM